MITVKITIYAKKKVLKETMNVLSDIFRYSPTQTGNNAALNKLFKGNHTNQKESRDNTKYCTNLRGYTFKIYQTKQLILQVYDLILCREIPFNFHYYPKYTER